MSEIPQWAWNRVIALSGQHIDPRHYVGPFEEAFARYIAEHEEPPVDPFTECIKLILGGFEGERHAQQYADSLRAEMAKRGLKIVEASNV